MLTRLPAICFWLHDYLVGMDPWISPRECSISLHGQLFCVVKFYFKTLFFLCLPATAWSQDSLRFLEPADTLIKPRLASVVGAQVAVYGGSLIFLSSAWYRDYNQTQFHTFDDSQEWLQIDKMGHCLTSWYLGRIGINMMEWSGMSKKKSILYGAAGGFLYMTGIEVLDGFSTGWGFSWSDMSANILGTGFIIGQKFIQNSPVGSGFKKGIGGVSLKFSFHQTNWPALRPSLLGDAELSNQILKDYNGQSYWLSFNISSFMRTDAKFPKWLNVAVGYGGEGMISGNPQYVMLGDGNTIWVERYRQYYLSLDIDLTKIKTKSRLLKTVFEVVSFIKIPAPAFEMSKKGLIFHPVYY